MKNVGSQTGLDKSQPPVTGVSPAALRACAENPPAKARRRLVPGLQRATGWLARAAGHLGAVMLLVLSLSITVGITLRYLRIENYWAYDLDLFSLAWLAFVGAVLTSLRNHHVTAGIALENILGGRGTVLAIIRFVIVGGFLVMFCVSGYRQALTSFVTHETTIDVVEWPVWIAKAALPLGAALWLAAEIHKLLKGLTGSFRDVTAQDTKK